jgi:hypothetical protein
MTINQDKSLFLTNENKLSQIDLQKHLFKTFQMLVELESGASHRNYSDSASQMQFTSCIFNKK